MANKKLLILESSGGILKSYVREGNSNDSGMILEGDFTTFDTQNNNGRIYRYSDFEPHLRMLQKKCQSRNLFGTVDHPENEAQPRLATASHIVESLEYNPQKNCVIGRIRLLDTELGKHAQAIIAGGGQLSISSRAIGSVREDKTVLMENLITYDLVADPGFGNAQLNKLNESLGILNENCAFLPLPAGMESQQEIIEKPTPTQPQIDESKLIGRIEDFSNSLIKKVDSLNEELRTQKLNNLKYESLLKELNKEKNKLNEMGLNNKGNDFEKFVHTYINEDLLPVITELQENVVQLKRDSEGIDMSELNEMKKQSRLTNTGINQRLDKIEGYLRHLNDVNEYNERNSYNYNSDELDSITEELTKIKSYLNEEVAPTVTKIEDYLNEEVAPTVTKIEDYLNEEVAPTVTKIEDYLNEEVAPTVTGIEKYLDEEVHSTVDGFINKFNDYNEHQVREIEESFLKLGLDVRESTVDAYKRAKLDELREGKSYADLSNKVDSLLESAKLRTEEVNNQAKIQQSLNFLNEEKQKEFRLLEKSDKSKIQDRILLLNPQSSKDMESIMETVLDPQSSERNYKEDLLTYCPKQLKWVFESLNADQQKQIFEQSKFYALNTANQKQQFWLNNRMLFNIKSEKEMLNESNNGYKVNYNNPYKSQLDSALKLKLKNK